MRNMSLSGSLCGNDNEIAKRWLPPKTLCFPIRVLIRRER
jgi:hypothetical protein